MANIKVQEEVQSIIKEGFLDKQSRFLKSWRRYSFSLSSRWFVLTPHVLMTFKERKTYNSPTEIIPLKAITSIKSADEESAKEFSFVNFYSWLANRYGISHFLYCSLFHFWKRTMDWPNRKNHGKIEHKNWRMISYMFLWIYSFIKLHSWERPSVFIILVGLLNLIILIKLLLYWLDYTKKW